MARFYQQVKTLISDIEKFLSVSIKDSKISKSALSQKTSVLEQISTLRNDYPQLQTADESSGPSKLEPTPQFTEQPGDDDDLYEDTDTVQASFQASDQDLCKKELAATDIAQITHSGQLRSRKVRSNSTGDKQQLGKKCRYNLVSADRKGNLLSKLAKKQYCILRGTYFYIYDKKTSKKQTDTFNVEGYHVTSLEDDAKKDFAFELSCDEKKTYIFEASNHEDLEEWLVRMYKATGSQVPISKPEEISADSDDEGLYEDTESLSLTVRSPIPSSSESPPPVSKTPARSGRPPPALPARTLPVPEPAEDDGEVLYEEGDLSLATPAAPASGTPSGESFPRSVPAEEPQDIYDDTVLAEIPKSPTDDEPQDIYDETMSPDPVVNKSSLFSPTLQAQSAQLERSSPRSSFKRTGPTPPPPKKALPPTPGESRPSPSDPQYDSMYYGIWDCTGGQEKELSFQRGDIITVLDRQYEERGWWVGQLHNKVGLVPKAYLSHAYERA